MFPSPPIPKLSCGKLYKSQVEFFFFVGGEEREEKEIMKIVTPPCTFNKTLFSTLLHWIPITALEERGNYPRLIGFMHLHSNILLASTMCWGMMLRVGVQS